MTLEQALLWADTFGRIQGCTPDDPPDGNSPALLTLAAEVRRLREEDRNELSSLRLKVKAAEGMAEAFENHRCGCQNQELRAALAAWNKANK